MATNWTLSQALKKITEGTDKAAIQDIGRRFPLTAVALAEIGQNAGAAKIIGAVPSHITTRKIESVLKDGVDQDADEEIEDDVAEEEEDKKPVKKTAKKPVKNAEVDDSEDEDEEDDPVALYKKCKKAGLKVAPKKSVKYYKDQLAKAAAAEEDADDDWDDEEEDEKPAAKKKPAKKSPAKKPAKKAEPEDDEDEDEDEWDI